jgi:uncharacterized YigZ family protein
MLNTISSNVTLSCKIQRSEFIAFLYPASSVEIAKEIFSRHNAEYRNATHNCYAYIIGRKQEWQYYSDQGEPSGTAGKPILNALLKYNLTNVLAVVTRYYGGIKLGVRGLIDAYHHTTDAAIQTANLSEFRSLQSLLTQFPYALLDSFKHYLTSNQAELKVIAYSDQIVAEIHYPEDIAESFHLYISDLTQKGLLQIIKPEVDKR